VALQTLVIIVAGPFMLVLIAMCVSLMKSLREEPDISLIPARERKVAREYLVPRSELPLPPAAPASPTTEQEPGPGEP